MNLHEFITYCELKGIVTTHRKLTPSFPSIIPGEYFQLNIQNKMHSVSIEYAVFEHWTTITSSTLVSHSFGAKAIYHPELDQIVEAIFPSN